MTEIRQLLQTIEKSRERFLSAELQDLIVEIDNDTGEPPCLNSIWMHTIAMRMQHLAARNRRKVNEIRSLYSHHSKKEKKKRCKTDSGVKSFLICDDIRDNKNKTVSEI